MAWSAHLVDPLVLEPLKDLAHPLEAQLALDLREDRVAHAIGAAQPTRQVKQLLWRRRVDLVLVTAHSAMPHLAPSRFEQPLSAHGTALVPP